MKIYIIVMILIFCKSKYKTIGLYNIDFTKNLEQVLSAILTILK